MKFMYRASIVFVGLVLFGCSTPPSRFGVYQQSDGTIGVHAPKDAKDDEAQQVAQTECQKVGRNTATLIDSRKTVNDRFPTTYNYICR
ncbi:MAG: hypothetical protein FGM17_05890 [Polynucleobacter sp.]|uniref:hypothetical protein n=1 Tax=Polynucleobacter sp. TaxID=2029855 RepID=UPI00216F7027|nr:hypothetical protein [Polynucleobacter sp.]MBU3670235.1 hypothetical protein [Polynucleobacter sp.]